MRDLPRERNSTTRPRLLRRWRPARISGGLGRAWPLVEDPSQPSTTGLRTWPVGLTPPHDRPRIRIQESKPSLTAGVVPYDDQRMHRHSLLASSVAAGSLLLLPALTYAAPPSLPESEVEADAPPADAPPADGEMLTADGQPMPTDTQPAGPGEDVVTDDAATGSELDASGDAELESAFDAETTTDASSEGDVTLGSIGENGPGMVGGRKEPTMMTLRGPSGLFYTSTAEVGELYSVRFHLSSDFFVKNDFFCCEGGGEGDRHARVRSTVNLGFTFTKWTEAYFSINNSANRNTRNQGARQDPPTVFALGDLSFGVKGAYQFLNGGVGLGGQVGLGLISGSERLRTAKVNFDIALLLGVDLRHLTAKHVPVRITGNIGWQLDNSIKLVDWGAIDDELSREVLRFASGANHSRVTTKLAIDFPIRLGKEKQYGIDPVIEYSWDISTYKEESFVELTEQFGGSPLKRSQAWLTLGLRANVYSGLFLNAAVDIGTTSPSYEYGPPMAPYQIILGLGWSIDPKPRVKEVAAPVVTDDLPPAVLDGRVLGRVTDVEGNPVANAKVSFPDMFANVILTDEAGQFTSFRFPEGLVMVKVEFADGSTIEQSADVRAGEDTEIDIIAEGAVAAEDPVFDGTFLNDKSEPLQVNVALDGMGIQESFQSDSSGRIAIALPLGEYKATLSAEGYEARDVTFTMTEQGVIMTETLTSGSATPAETPLISGSKSRIKLKKTIKYNGNDLDIEKSTEVLDQLAGFLKVHPEFVKVEIRVHTDDRGSPGTRSQSRADQVVEYLTKKGIDASRLVANGYGAKDPVAVNITSDGRAQNNRTEIKVKDYDESKVKAE
jgi:outer membrane protein OmpA-like peptidoglycan-associated protein